MHALPTQPQLTQATELGCHGRDLIELSQPDVDLVVHEKIGFCSSDVEIRRGTQASLGRTIAVRQVVAGARASAAENLRQEARLLAQLDHPNILPIHDIFEGAAGPIVLVPLVAGCSWAQRMSQPHRVREHFGADDLLAWHVRVLLQVCQAVQFAHEQGVVHRDLRPESVLVGDLGEVYVSDWSLACHIRCAPPLTGAQIEAIGTAAHLAPEHVMRTVGRVGPQTDVYQLGGLLYLILTGDAPHTGDTIEETTRHLLFHDPPVAAQAPPPLARVCQRALSRNSAARHATVAEFRRDLEMALAQRSAWTLTQVADEQFEALRRELREPTVRRDALFRTFGALRLGYQRALAEAPDQLAPQRRLERATELVVAHLHERGEPGAAAALEQHLGESAPSESPAAAPVARVPATTTLPSNSWLMSSAAAVALPLVLAGVLLSDLPGAQIVSWLLVFAAMALLKHVSEPSFVHSPRAKMLGTWLTGAPLCVAVVQGMAVVLGGGPAAQAGLAATVVAICALLIRGAPDAAPSRVNDV